MLHLKGLDKRRSEAAFAKSRGFGSCAGIRIGRRKSGGKPPHSKSGTNKKSGKESAAIGKTRTHIQKVQYQTKYRKSRRFWVVGYPITASNVQVTDSSDRLRTKLD